MIAANDPQEFVPGGRQQACNHPDLLDLDCPNVYCEGGDDLLSHQLEKVNLDENSMTEWWVLRKYNEVDTPGKKFSLSTNNNNEADIMGRLPTKSSFSASKSQSDMLFEDSWSFKSFDSSHKKLISEYNNSKLLQRKRLSSEMDKSDMRGSNLKLNTLANSGAKSRIDFCTTSDSVEEEIYVKGSLVVWSKGLSCSAEELGRKIFYCYTSYFPLKDVVWCSFKPEVIEEDPELCRWKEPPRSPLDCLCIADTQNLRVYTKDDEDFITMLPIKVKKMWPTYFGILIEREDNDTTKKTLPLVYSLTHPLDTIAPVVFIKNASLKLIENESFQIVFASDNLCMIYDGDARQHIICRIRRVRMEEMLLLHKTMASVSTTKNQFDSVMESNRGLFQMITNSFSRPTSSCSNILSRGQSPLLGPAAALTTNRCPTPDFFAVGDKAKKASNTSLLNRLSRLNSSVRSTEVSMTGRYSPLDVTQMDLAFIEPAHCLEHIWNETQVEGAINTPATNVFLSEDLLGQWYICFLVTSRSQLSIVKYDYSNNSDDIVFGMASNISAKDAVAIPQLRMLAVVEYTGNVMLYSGLTAIGKLHIGGALAQHIPSPYAVRKNSKFFNSPFPRRSSLLPMSTPADTPRFDEHLLSPVLPTVPGTYNPTIMQIPEIGDASKISLTGVRDCIDSRITLQYSDGSYYRVALPNMTNILLIDDCLNALRISLPRDLVMTVLSKWYSTRNSPGATDMSNNDEWKSFTKLLLELLGYDTSSVSKGSKSVEHLTPCAQVKRQKHNEDGSLNDWRYINQEMHEFFRYTSDLLQLEHESITCLSDDDDILHINTSAILFPHIRIIHFVFHLVYEDLKLNTLRIHEMKKLASFLTQIANDLNLEQYVVHYWKDFPTDLPLYDPHKEQISNNDLKCVIKWDQIPERPSSILEYLYDLCAGKTRTEGDDGCSVGYPVINNINTKSKDVVHLFAIYLRPDDDTKLEQYMNVIAPPGSRNKVDNAKTPLRRSRTDVTNETRAQKLVLMMVALNITSRELESFPVGVNFILCDAAWSCRDKPPTDWPTEAYNLMQRPDLVSQAVINTDNRDVCKFNLSEDEVAPKVNQSRDGTLLDGMEEINTELLKLRFAADQRVLETRRLLQSSKPVPITIVQRPDVADHDFLEEQEKHLFAICTRTMALSVGRGMFTLHTSTPNITEPLPIPPLCLTGKAHPRGTTVELSHIDTPSNMANWPQFHNGVANGLRLNPSAKYVDSTWIMFNKPRNNNETMMEHAGFLLALGLNGHLRNLQILSLFEYLIKLHEMTSVGLLLGLGAAFRGTSNLSVTKMFSVHVESLLPPTTIELDIPQNLQVASLLGLGLLYEGTANRRMIETMLTEIGRPPGPEMENSIDRQSYSLAAGLALGLVTLRRGDQPVGLSDTNVAGTLHYYMVGGSKRPLIGSQKEKYKVPSFQIREGTTVNLDVTAPGATLALGLMYLGTGNKSIAGLMNPPETQYMLDFVRPDFLMLRTLSRALIMWHEVEPENQWVEKQVPTSIRVHCLVEPNPHLDLDYEAMNQAYCNIVAGACFAIGLKFAGSADETAFEVLLNYCHMFTSLTSKSIAELAGKPTIETCLNLILLSASMVMAGTGNLDLIRIIRYLRRRVGLASSAVVTYGSHLAMHMALGLLFLGGGRYTLSNSASSVAALICAFYPKYPTHSNDNRYHLQAFRHLYVLAAEPRMLIPRDIINGKMCYANLSIIKLDGTTLTMKAPALLPNLNTLYKVSINDERYWPILFERERNWNQLLKVLSSSGKIEVKQRAGCLSHIEDKTGFRSELAHTLAQSNILPWNPPARSIVSFSSDVVVRLFADHFLKLVKTSDFETNEGPLTAETHESKLQQTLTQITYESVIQDKLSVLPLLVALTHIVCNLATSTTSVDIWHFRIVWAFVLRRHNVPTITNNEFLIALYQKAVNIIDSWEPNMRTSLRAYLLRENVTQTSVLSNLSKYIAFYNLPYGISRANDEILSLIAKLNDRYSSDSETIDKVLRILEYIR